MSQVFGNGLIRDEEELKRRLEEYNRRKSMPQVNTIASFPSSVDLEPYFPPISNQGFYGTCVAFATAALREYYAIRATGVDPKKATRLAPFSIYTYNGSRGKNSGMSVKEAIGALYLKGVCEAYAMPYTDSQVINGMVQPMTSQQISKAAKYKIDFEHIDKGENEVDRYSVSVLTLEDAKAQLVQGNPVVMSFNDYAAFGSALNFGEYAGLAGTPDTTEEAGGHAVLIVGYDDNKFGGVLKVRNSWGASRGDRGYFYFKYTDLSKYTNFGGLELDGTTCNLSNLTRPVPPHIFVEGFVNNSGQPELTISATGATSLNVYRDDVKISSGLSGKSTSFQDSTAEDGVHFYYVEAVNSIGATLSKKLASWLDLDVDNGNIKLVAASGTGTVPSIPTVTVGSPTLTSLKLTMFATNATAYDVFRSSSPTGPFSQAGSNVTSPWTDTGLSSGLTYYYYVVGKNGAIVGPKSSVVNTSTGAIPSTCSLNVGSPTTASLLLSYGAPGATSFDIFRGSSKIVTNRVETSYTDSGLTPGTTYSYYVVAKNNYGSSTSSIVSNSTSPAGTPPSTPSLNIGFGTSNSLPLNFSSSGATSYEIYKNGILFSGKVTSSPFVVSGLSANTTYSFFVIAKNANGSATSATINSLTGPVQPSLTVGSATTSSLKLTYSAVGATSYDIFQNGKLLKTVTSGSETISGLTPGTSYSFSVVAKNSGGSSPASITVTQSTLSTISPPSACTLAISTVTASKVCRLVFSSSGGNPAPSYTIKYKYFANSSWSNLVSNASSPFDYNGYGLGAKYDFKVTATNSAGSVDSNVVSFTFSEPKD